MVFTLRDNKFSICGPEKAYARSPYFSQLMIASLSLTALATHGCSMEKIIEKHERICRQNMKIIVHDENLWREYRAQSESAYQKEVQEVPPMTGRTYYNSVGEFSIAYGENKTHNRMKIPENKIVQDDLFIIKGKNIVAQIVDYIAYYKSIDGPTSFSCLGYYKNLNIRENDR